MKQTLNKWLFIIASLATYLLFARYRYLLIFKDSYIVLFWIPTGISLAIILIKGYKYIPLVFIGNYLVTTIISTDSNITFYSSFIIQFSSSLLNTFEAFLIAYLIFKISKSNLIFSSLKNTASFIFIVVLVSLLTATIGSILYSYFNNLWHSYIVILYSWWINDILGILIVTPVIMSLPKKKYFNFNSLKILEFVFYLTITCSFLLAITKTQYHIDFLLFPILLIGLFRFGKFIGFSTILLVGLYVAIQNSDYQTIGSFTQSEGLLIYQLYFSVACFIMLIASALLEDQKSKESILIKSKTQFQSIFNSVNEAILICNKNSGNILGVNNHACEWLGYTHIEFEKMSISDIFSNNHPVIKKNATKFFEKSLISSQNFQCEIDDKTNTTYHCSIQLTKAHIFENDNIIATIRDDSEKHRLEKEITHSYIEAQEEEKQRFGEEIHDSILQTLAAEQIFINAIDKIDNRSNSKITNYLKKLNKLNLDAIDAIQQIANSLMSKQLKEQGLLLSLENLCVDMSSEDKVEFNFVYKNIREKDMSDTVKINIFRIAQELTNSCVNYSSATISNLQITKTPFNVLEFVFYDNDKDFKFTSLQKLNNGRSMKNIDRRLKYLNGKLFVNSESKTGFEIKITIPLS